MLVFFGAVRRAGGAFGRELRRTGPHRTLAREGRPNVVFAFHDRDEIGPRMLARIAKQTCPQFDAVVLERDAPDGHRSSFSRYEP
jgi:hypothetical protein